MNEETKFYNEAEIDAVFNALPYFRGDAVLKAKKIVEQIIKNEGMTEQRNTALEAFNRYLHAH